MDRIIGWYTRLRKLLGRETAQGSAEYGLLLGLVAVTTIGALTIVGQNLSSFLAAAGDEISLILRN